jgi:glucose/arabinose dehydrogenase
MHSSTKVSGRLFYSVLPAAIGMACLLSPRFAHAQLTHPPLVDPIPAPISSSGITVRLRPVLSSNLVSPVAGAVAPGDRHHLYVADQPGTIWAIKVSGDDAPSSRLFLDMTKRIIPLGLGPLKYDERGLLGLAFHPEFKRNRLFYTYATERVNGPADFSTQDLNNPTGEPANAQNVLLEWHALRNEDGELTVDVAKPPRELLRVDKPYINHNGGSLNFGPDGLLYLTLGDGGNANDQGIGHEFNHGNAQTLVAGNLLGKIIRIDPLGHNSANGHYGIPADNPFADEHHPLAGPHEIWAYGFRNPWRASFDSKTGDLYAADVGQNDIEEIDIIKKGGNYGWPIKEGSFLFETSLPDRAGEGFVYANSLRKPTDLIDPIAEYDHADNEQPPAHSVVDSRVAAVGGFVYHGDELPAVRDSYVFGDYSTEIGLPVAGHLWILRGRKQPIQQLDVITRPKGSDLGLAVLGFAQDSRGELYLLANRSGTLLGTTGLVLKLTPVDEDD